MRLEEIVTKESKWLEGESRASVWSRDELAIYALDGYNLFVRRTKCIFDLYYVENLPTVGTHSSDEAYQLLKQIPNLLLGEKREYTRPIDATLAPAGAVGPAGASSYVGLDAIKASGLDVDLATHKGRLPHDYVEIEDVRHDGISLIPEWSDNLARDVDANYESAAGGPAWFTLDKDGMFVMRRYPSSDGQAVYAEIEGCWGVEVQDDSYIGEIEGSWGAMCCDDEEFPIGGPWGAPTRLHPDDNNTRVELLRLGLDPTESEFELPSVFLKYVGFWIRSRAFKREGPGQDLKLSQHYADRFEMGIERAVHRLGMMEYESADAIGGGGQMARQKIGGLKITLPANYGVPRRRGRRY